MWGIFRHCTRLKDIKVKKKDCMKTYTCNLILYSRLSDLSSKNKYLSRKSEKKNILKDSKKDIHEKLWLKR